MDESDALGRLKDLTDEALVDLSQNGDDAALEYLLSKYLIFVRHKARSYFLVGADKDDLVQEGMIGLFKAVRDFKKDKMSTFKAFAELCITRQIITAIKSATRQKHSPLNSYVSLNKPLFDEDYNITLLDVLEFNSNVNPEDIFIHREQFNNIGLKMSEILSKFEFNVLLLYLEGKSYQEIAEALKKEPKSIDNALQRIKHKFEKLTDLL